MEVSCHITGDEVSATVKHFRTGSALGMDEICLKFLDVSGLSWLTHLCSTVWTSGTVPLEWKTGVPFFSRKGNRGCTLAMEHLTHQPPWKVLCQGDGEESLRNNIVFVQVMEHWVRCTTSKEC